MSIEISEVMNENPEVAADLDQLRYLVFQGKKGDTGDSAYEEAVALGFVGTEAEWIASLKGEKGDTGDSGAVFLELKTVSGRQVITYNGEQITGAEIDAMYLSGALPVVEYSGRIFVPNKNCYNSGSPSARNTSFMFSRPVSAIETTFISVRYDSSVVNIINQMVYPYFDSGDDEGKVLTVGDDDTLHWETPQGGSAENAVLYTAQSLTDAQKTQARTNVGAGTYSKPSGGIPKSDLASAVQTSLGKADTAVQPSAIADMATATYVQQQIAAIPDELPAVTASDNGNVLAVNNGEWSADSPVIVSGTDAQVTNAVNDYLTQYGVPLRLSEEIKQALLDCFENVAWINGQGQTYYDALYAALYPPKTLVSISSAFNQGSAVIYDTDSLDTLKQYLTVTAIYDDTSTGVVTNYTLSGTLTVGTSTITVTYGGKTTTFNVTVTHATRNTTAEIAESGKILVRNGGVFPITNGCYTIKYDMPSSTNVLYPSGAIPTKSNEVIYSSGASVIVYDSNGTAVNYVNEFDRWAQEESGTLTDFSQSWTLTDPYSKIAFSLDERYLDRAYMYDKTTGHIWFAGVNTPYYGMSNISEASA